MVLYCDVQIRSKALPFLYSLAMLDISILCLIVALDINMLCFIVN